MTQQPTSWIPEICYEEADTDGGLSSHIPFIQVPMGEDMPGMLFVFETRETGEFEPGDDGEMLPIVEMDLHQYADMDTLKQNLDTVAYDIVRVALGLEPLAIAEIKGQRLTQNIRNKVE
jgi:hypothetical protein